MRKLIHVTKEHIKAARTDAGYTSFSCPVARAVESAGLSNNGTRVTVSSIQLNYYDFNSQRVPAPRSVRRFVNRFDQGKPVQPFNFYLVVPDV